MAHPLETLGIQAARVLADIETLRRDYEPAIAQADPELEKLLDEAVTSLDRVVTRTTTLEEPSRRRSPGPDRPGRQPATRDRPPVLDDP